MTEPREQELLPAAVPGTGKKPDTKIDTRRQAAGHGADLPTTPPPITREERQEITNNVRLTLQAIMRDEPADVEKKLRSIREEQNMRARDRMANNHEASSALMQRRLGSYQSSTLRTELPGVMMRMRNLDPKQSQGVVGRAMQLVSRVPLLNKVQREVNRHQTAEQALDGITSALDRHQQALEKDLEDMNGYRDHLIEAKTQTYEEIETGKVMLEIVEQTLKEETLNPEWRTMFEDQLVTPLKRQIMDMETNLAVLQQTLVGNDLIMVSNRNLSDGLQRARTTGVMALKQALYQSSAIEEQMAAVSVADMLQQNTERVLVENAVNLQKTSKKINQRNTRSVISVTVLEQVDRAMQQLDADSSQQMREQGRLLDDESRRLNALITRSEERGRQLTASRALADTAQAGALPSSTRPQDSRSS